MKYSKEDVKQAREMLEKALTDGDTVYTILKHVAASGMSRHIDLYIIGDDKRPYYLSWAAAVITGRPRAKSGAVKIGGCGMDMGFALVEDVKSAMFYDREKKEYTRKIHQAWL